jgi:hypothetical protein
MKRQSTLQRPLQALISSLPDIRKEKVTMRKTLSTILGAFLTLGSGLSSAAELTDEEIDNIVRRSYQYVAMYNVINNFAMVESNPLGSKGWNKTKFNLELADHTVKAIARPNNDTYYIISMLDLRDDAVVITYPAFDTDYASLEVSGYDHYVTIPIATSKGDFKEETTLLYYSDRTKNYDGKTIKGVDRTLKMTSDFVTAFLRVSAHETKDGRNVKALDNFKLATLSEFQGKEPVQSTAVDFPAWGNDQKVFKNNFLEVMQFVFNHISFDPNNEMDKAVLESMKKLGVQPGKEFDSTKVAEVDGKRVAEVAEKVFDEALAIWNSPDGNPYLFQVFLPKGEMNFDAMVTQSAVGPIGLPASEAVYPGIGTASGAPLNAMNDYVIKMASDELPPADAFWSTTLYDTKNGFFIPNDRFKYIVGKNGGMQLNEDGGIEIHIAAEKPAGVPEDNWLPINREDIDLDIIMRIYAPRLDELKAWKTPKAEKQ